VWRFLERRLRLIEDETEYSRARRLHPASTSPRCAVCEITSKAALEPPRHTTAMASRSAAIFATVRETSRQTRTTGSPVPAACRTQGSAFSNFQFLV
jgi:hypothetical protein